MSVNALKRPPYGNNRVLNHEGKLLFKCSYKKIKWYLDRDLANIISTDPMTIQLNFVPGGHGNAGDTFHLSDKENKCVVCGCIEELSMHHIVPHCYRKHFPSEWKEHNSHDVLPLCSSCHTLYELQATEFKRSLANAYDAPLSGEQFDEVRRISRVGALARALVNYGDEIPDNRQIEILDQISNLVGTQDFDLNVLKDYLPDKPTSLKDWNLRTHGEMVAEQLDDLYNFIKTWRSHFVTTMKPAYLPKGWSIDYMRNTWSVR
jgi:exonuclease 3'-5' domain-containing protein 2